MRSAISLLQSLRATPRRRWWTTFVLLAGLSGAWALATPLFASPDEPAHAIRAAAVARGELTGTEPAARSDIRPGSLLVDVPAVYARAGDVGCFAFYRNTTAACFTFSGSTRDAPVATSAAKYPPTYYAVVGLPSLALPSAGGVYLMRLLSTLLFAALLASAVVTVECFATPWIVALGLAVAITPMMLFLGGLVNPNGLEIAAATTLWIGGLALVRAAGLGSVSPRLVARTGIAAAVLTLTRSLSPLLLVVILATLVVAAGAAPVRALLRLPSIRLWGAVVAVATAAQIAWIVVVKPLSSSEASSVARLSDSELLRATTGKSAFLYRGMIGIFGWLDTPAPYAVVLLWTMVLGLVVVLALASGERRGVAALGAAIAATVLVPIVGELREARTSGLFWQGRYTLPIAVGIPILAGVSIARSRWREVAPRRLAAIGVTVLAAAQVLAFAQTLRRYAVGYDGKLMYWIGPRWSPPLGALALTLAFAAAIGLFSVWLVTLDPAPVAGEQSTEAEPREGSSAGMQPP